MSPKLILVNGPCGVGKTTFAKSLQPEIPQSLLIEGDELRRWFEEHPVDRFASAKRLTELIIQIANAQLKAGHTVIFDKTIPFDGVVEQICDEVGRDNVIELVLTLPESEILQRVEARGEYNDMFTPEKVQQFINYFENYTSDAKHTITVDMSEPDLTGVMDQINNKITLT